MIWQNGTTTIMEQDDRLFISTGDFVEISLPLRDGDREKLDNGADPIRERWTDENDQDACALLLAAESRYLQSMLDKVRNHPCDADLQQELAEAGFILEESEATEDGEDDERDFILESSYGDHWLTCIDDAEHTKWIAYSNGQWLD